MVENVIEFCSRCWYNNFEDDAGRYMRLLLEQQANETGGQGDMSNYSYSGEINQYNFVFGEFDRESIRKIFERIFATYQPKIRSDMFDSFCDDFYALVSDIQAPNERIWRMIITDMLFHYHERGYLEEASPDNTIKRKQFAVIATVVLGQLRAGH